METPIEAIEFIASSKNRVEVLDALAEEGCDRADLQSGTGAHASTIGRCISSIETPHVRADNHGGSAPGTKPSNLQ